MRSLSGYKYRTRLDALVVWNSAEAEHKEIQNDRDKACQAVEAIQVDDWWERPPVKGFNNVAELVKIKSARLHEDVWSLKNGVVGMYDWLFHISDMRVRIDFC